MIKNSRNLVRIIIRRPHAYEFVTNLAPSNTQSYRGTTTGVTLGNGSHFPIPGIYFLDPKGNVLEKTGLFDSGAKAELVDTMVKLTSL